MNDIWDILGIEPTEDKKAIRRAFAAQSKLHHPEEEPEYFAALNQAYKAALEYGAGAEKIAFPADASTADRTYEAKKGSRSAHSRPDSKAENWKAGDEEKGREPLWGNEQQETEDGRTVHREQQETEDSRTVHGEQQETEDDRTVHGEQQEAKDDEVSLLERLNRAAEQAVQKSMETGALHDFIVFFENPKQAKQADTWKRFFLSEAFLGEQFSEEFGKGLLAYLSGQNLCPWDNLPMGLLQELAIAYAFIPHFAGEEYFEGLKYPKEWYKVSVENTFPGRRYAAEIFNMQGRECDLKSMTNRILRQPANKVRHNAFSDYLAMREMSRDGRLTDREKEVWQKILGLCQPYYLFERNGKKPGSGAYESRSESVVKLYVQWLKDERLPEEVLLFLYKKLDFKTLDRSSTRGLYGVLKEAVLRQCPRAEEILFGEDGTEQRITRLYKIYSSILNDNHNNYDKFIYGETPEIRERAEAFFALPDWEQLKGEKGLFERIYSASKRIVMPRTVAETLVRHLESGDFPEPERTELTESLLRSLSTERMCRELDYRCEISLGSTAIGEIGDSPDFWQYFLMRGFGFRHGKIRGSWEENYIYVEDGQCYLPAYINYIYAPSRAWQRCFTGFDQEQEAIEVPVSAVCPMPGGRKLRVEFHYHYCLYFVENFVEDSGKASAGDSGNDGTDGFRNEAANEVQVTVPVLAFSELQEYAGNLKKPEEFFFLLAVTAIEDSDRSAARALIADWLGRIPVHPFIIPTVAGMLAADNDRIPMAAQNPGVGGAEKGPKAVLYSEGERFCFRALVLEDGFSIWRQMDYGWQDIIFRSAEPGWKKCEEYTWKEYCLPQVTAALSALRQPRPSLRAAYSLENMDIEQKSVKILEAMGFPENREGYCVLRYGAKKEKRHDRVFYGALAPFGFDLKAHSTAHVRSRDYLLSSSNTKIKEPKALVGRFGWGFKYSPRSDYGPMYVYQGESGTFYAYGAIRMHRADSLDRLLADFFREEWEGVTEAEAYEGCLTVSRLDHRLEYCYTEADMRQSMYSVEETAADKFTLFGGYGMWMEFVRWMDGILKSELPSWVNAVVVGFDWEKGGALTFIGIHEDEAAAEIEELEEKGDLEPGDMEEDRTKDRTKEGADDSSEDMWDRAERDITEASRGNSLQDEVYLPETPLLVWAKGMDRRDRAEFLAASMQWYVDCGRFAEHTGGRRIRITVSG